MEHWEVILKAGVEGGSITLYGRYTGRGWIFERDVLDQTPALIDEATIQYKSDSVYSWEEALELFDKHPWHLFCPLEVHPLFRGAVLAAVLRRDTDCIEIVWMRRQHDNAGPRRQREVQQQQWAVLWEGIDWMIFHEFVAESDRRWQTGRVASSGRDIFSAMADRENGSPQAIWLTGFTSARQPNA